MGVFEDLTGRQFNNWLVLGRAEDYVSPKGYKATYWLCECQCENKTRRKLRTGCLKSESSKSCGCRSGGGYVSRVNNLVGKQYGKLTVIERYYGDNIKNKRNKVVWLCRCECGNTKPVIVCDLRSGKVKSCGCMLSNAENEIGDFLKANHVIFDRQYTFDNCKNKNVLPFDFAIFDYSFELKFLIEANGHYHYNLTGFSDAEEKLLYTQNNDMIKIQYCKYNYVDLLIIPYWEFNKKEELIVKKLNKYGLIDLKDVVYLYG